LATSPDPAFLNPFFPALDFFRTTSDFSSFAPLAGGLILVCAGGYYAPNSPPLQRKNALRRGELKKT
jgi:hypothetical protein